MSSDDAKRDDRSMKLLVPESSPPAGANQGTQPSRSSSETPSPRVDDERPQQVINIGGSNNISHVAGRDLTIRSYGKDGSGVQSGARSRPAIQILFLASNPQDSARLRLDREVREIDGALREAEFRDRFDLHQQWAVRVSDLQRLLLQFKPQILHFSGHGSAEDALFFEGEDGRSQALSGGLLARLLRIFSRQLRCVVLNACYSRGQAEAIAQEIECVVGMSRAIEDRAAIRFATAFYRALAFGQDVQTAFDLGCVEIALFQPQEANTPQLITRGQRASEIVLSPP